MDEQLEKSAGHDHGLIKVCGTCRQKFSSSIRTCPDDGSSLIEEQNLVGKIFADKYEILDVLGEGGMSIVYKARHKYMDRMVAIKLLLEHLVNDQSARLRFEQESKACSSLSHHNIVNVYDFGVTADGQAYFVMDCIEGESLADILDRRTRLPIPEALEIFKQTCDGLEHAHSKGVVHRDLKPSNLMLINQDDGSVLLKVVDFGIAKVIPRDGKPRQNITQTGEIFGSPLYMSPEQCEGKSLDQRSDIYSLGCLMYETLAGTPPFMGESFIKTVLMHVNNKPPSCSESAPEAQIPQQLESVLMKCLAKSPDDRYQTVSEVRQSLLDAALEAGVEGLRAGAVPVPSRKISTLGRTFNRIKLGSGELVSAGEVKYRTLLRLAVVSFFVLLSSITALFLWQGPEGDQGMNYLRIKWQIDQYLAEQALKSQDYEQARKLLSDARQTATQFSDKNKRLLDTLYLLAETYGKSGRYLEQERTNREIMQINSALVFQEVGNCEELLNKLRRKSDSTVAATMNQLEAEANADSVVLCCKKLTARSYFSRAEQLLVHAIITYDHLKLENHERIAEFKTLLADCLINQQRLTEVRPLLSQALDIRLGALNFERPDTCRRLCKAYLKIGQFDRDQTDFKPASEELKKGIELLEQRLPGDRELLAEAYNSYADLLRQMGDKKGAAENLKKANAAASALVRHTDELLKKEVEDR